jgi:hypothetical protein
LLFYSRSISKYLKITSCAKFLQFYMTLNKNKSTSPDHRGVLTAFYFPYHFYYSLFILDLELGTLHYTLYFLNGWAHSLSWIVKSRRVFYNTTHFKTELIRTLRDHKQEKGGKCNTTWLKLDKIGTTIPRGQFGPCWSPLVQEELLEFKPINHFSLNLRGSPSALNYMQLTFIQVSGSYPHIEEGRLRLCELSGE